MKIRTHNNLIEWLEDRKIYFETVAATLLSIMAILVSIFQTISGCQQTKLIALQTELARQQWNAEQKRSEIQKSADWQRLRDAIWEIMDQYPRSGILALDTLDSGSKAAWFSNIRRLLDSQTDNPVLIKDRVCLGCWRNAISSAKFSKEFFESVDLSHPANFCSTKAGSILRDVSYVWKKLILHSDEVSPTGGRPSEAEQ